MGRGQVKVPKPAADKREIEPGPAVGNEQGIRGQRRFEFIEAAPVDEGPDLLTVINPDQGDFIASLKTSGGLNVQIDRLVLKGSKDPPFFTRRQALLEKIKIFPVGLRGLQFTTDKAVPSAGKDLPVVTYKVIPG